MLVLLAIVACTPDDDTPSHAEASCTHIHFSPAAGRPPVCLDSCVAEYDTLADVLHIHSYGGGYTLYAQYPYDGGVGSYPADTASATEPGGQPLTQLYIGVVNVNRNTGTHLHISTGIQLQAADYLHIYSVESMHTAYSIR